MNEDKVKKDIKEIETINIKLGHRVSKLITENEHLKQTYKQLYDSIKPIRIQSKEQCDALINQANQKSVEISDLNASLQEKVLVITALKNELRKLKGKYLADNVVTKNTIALEMLKIDVEPIAPKLLNNSTCHSYYLRHTQEQAAILREVVKQGKSQNPLNNPLDSACEVFTNIGYIWRPTGRTFTIVENVCPLTRITTTTEVPYRKPTAFKYDTPKTVVTLVYSRKPKKSKTNVPVSKPKIIKSIFANNKEPNKSWGSIVFDVPSSSLDECSKIPKGSRGKDIGIYDYQIENVTILRVYYVEGLGHNLFSVGQFYVTICNLISRVYDLLIQGFTTCFIHNLEGVDLSTGSRGNNLYTLSLGHMMASSPICVTPPKITTTQRNTTWGATS
ncbi:hypothetical protein Tco_0307164 [Tanacetum coccineum]